MNPIRFLEIRGHLCQHLITGDADIDSKAQPVPDGLAEHFCSQDRVGCHLPGDTGHIDKSFVYTELLHGRRIFPKQLHELPGIFFIDPAPGRNDNQIRTFFQRLSDGFGCLNPVGACRHGLGKYDPVTALSVSADGGRDCAKIQGLSQLLNPVQCFPAQIGIVDINVKDDPFHGLTLHPVL